MKIIKSKLVSAMMIVIMVFMPLIEASAMQESTDDSISSGKWVIKFENDNIVLGKTTAQDLVDLGWNYRRAGISQIYFTKEYGNDDINAIWAMTDNMDCKGLADFYIDDFVFDRQSLSGVAAISINGITNKSTPKEVYDALGMPDYFSTPSSITEYNEEGWVFWDRDSSRNFSITFNYEKNKTYIRLDTLERIEMEEMDSYIKQNPICTNDVAIFRQEHPDFFED